jgi:Zn-dependent peptidase ImmA (M78 family)
LRPKYVRTDYAISKARALRKSCKIEGPSVNIEDVIRSSGIMLKYVFDLECPTAVRVDGRYMILIPPTNCEPYDYWSLGHEFGHIYLLHCETYPVDRIVMGTYVELLTHEEISILEQECDVFVSEFLMPEEWVHRLISYPVSEQVIKEMKNAFRVSLDDMIKRLDQLGLLRK